MSGTASYQRILQRWAHREFIAVTGLFSQPLFIYADSLPFGNSLHKWAKGGQYREDRKATVPPGGKQQHLTAWTLIIAAGV